MSKPSRSSHQAMLGEFYECDGERHISERAERLERYRFDCIIHVMQRLSMHDGLKRLRVVDAGAGWGQLSVTIAKGGHQVTAIDSAESRLKRFEDQARELGIVQLQGSIEQTALPDQAADCVICSEVLEHLPEPARAVAEFTRITRPGGLLIVTVPNAEVLQPPHCGSCGAAFPRHGHLHSFTMQDMRVLLEPRAFEIAHAAVIAKRIASALVRRAVLPFALGYLLDRIQPTRPNCGWLLVGARRRGV